MGTTMIDELDGATISIMPLKEGDNEDANRELLELQLKMATCSINHEYARMEFEDASDRERREELIEYMNECRERYFEARSELSVHDSYAVAEFEADLMRQKQMMLPVSQA